MNEGQAGSLGLDEHRVGRPVLVDLLCLRLQLRELKAILPGIKQNDAWDLGSNLAVPLEDTPHGAGGVVGSVVLGEGRVHAHHDILAGRRILLSPAAPPLALD